MIEVEKDVFDNYSRHYCQNEIGNEIQLIVNIALHFISQSFNLYLVYIICF